MSKNNDVILSYSIFKSRIAHQPNNENDCSKRLIKLYELQYDDKHRVVVKDIGERDIYAEIQTHAHDNDIERIIKTIQITQNPNLYVSNNGVDLLGMPESVVDAYNKVSNVDEKIKKDDFFKVKSKEYEKKYGTGLTLSEYVKIFDKNELINFYQSKIDELQKINNSKEKGDNN